MPKRKKARKMEVKMKGMATPSKRGFSIPIHHLVAIGLIVGIAWIAYSNSFHVPFHFDDRPNILQNPVIQIKVFSWDRLKQLIQITYGESIRIFSYLTLALNYHFGEFNVIGYHLVNFLIHVAAGIFLYGFLMLTFNLPSLKETYGPLSYKMALLTSLIFITHPIQTQSVTYIVQRMSSMAGMFYLLTMVLYVQGRLSSSHRRWVYFGGAGLAYLLGIFSKENVAILPLFVLLYEFYFFQNLTITPREKKIFITLALIVGFIALIGLIVWGKRYYELILEGYKIRDFTLSERVLTQFRVVLYYLTLLVYPHPSRLNLDYDFSVSKTIFDPPTTLISILIVVGLIGYSLWIAKRRPIPSFCILWYFGNLAIESSIFPLEMVYEHRLYLPSVGPFILFSLAAVRSLEGLRMRLFLKSPPPVSQKPVAPGRGNKLIKQSRFHIAEIILFTIVLLPLVTGTCLRNRVWNNEIELWTLCVQKSPGKARPYVNLGFAYYNEENFEKAYELNQKAIELNPRYSEAYHNLGLIYQKMKDLDRAALMVEKAIELAPDLNMAHYSLGSIYFEKKEFEKSAQAFKRFLNEFPYFPNVHHLLGVIYVAQKKFDQAIEEFEWELRINPSHSLAHLNLGQIYWYEFQEKEKALKHLKAALALDPFLPNREGIQILVRQLERIL